MASGLRCVPVPSGTVLLRCLRLVHIWSNLPLPVSHIAVVHWVLRCTLHQLRRRDHVFLQPVRLRAQVLPPTQVQHALHVHRPVCLCLCGVPGVAYRLDRAADLDHQRLCGKCFLFNF